MVLLSGAHGGAVGSLLASSKRRPLHDPGQNPERDLIKANQANRRQDELQPPGPLLGHEHRDRDGEPVQEVLAADWADLSGAEEAGQRRTELFGLWGCIYSILDSVQLGVARAGAKSQA